MYHYVGPASSDGVTRLAPGVFDAQLRRLAVQHRFVTVEEFVQTRHEQTGMALITFDDAVRDQYDHAFAVLESHGAPAVFFAPMRPYSDLDDRWSTQHLLHALAEHLGWEEFARRVDALVGSVTVDTAAMDRLYHYEVPRKRRLKYLFAFALAPATARAVLTAVNADEGLRAEDWFMAPRELRELQAAGHAIGGHGFDHVPYDTLTPKQQAADMHLAQYWTTQVCGAMGRALAYPFGRSGPETAAIARGCGYTACFDVEERVDCKVLDAALARRAA